MCNYNLEIKKENYKDNIKKFKKITIKAVLMCMQNRPELHDLKLNFLLKLLA